MTGHGVSADAGRAGCARPDAPQGDGKVPLHLKWRLLKFAMDRKELPGSARDVLFFLLEDYDRDGQRICAPSLDRLAEFAQTSRRTVVSAIDKLVAAGLVSRLEKGGGRYRSTHYGFPWIEARLAELAAETSRPAAPAPRSSRSRRGRVASGRNCEDNREAGCGDSVKPASPDTPDSKTDEKPTPSPTPPTAQRHFLLPIEGAEEMKRLSGMVCYRFKIRRADAEAMTRSWLKRCKPAWLGEVLADAAAEGITRDDLSSYVQRQLRAADNPAHGPAGGRGPSAVADGADADPRWQRVRAKMTAEIGAARFRSWLAPVGFQEIRGDTVVLLAPTRQAAGWVQSNYADRLRAAWHNEVPEVRAVRVEAAEGEPAAAAG